MPQVSALAVDDQTHSLRHLYPKASKIAEGALRSNMQGQSRGQAAYINEGGPSNGGNKSHHGSLKSTPAQGVTKHLMQNPGQGINFVPKQR